MPGAADWAAANAVIAWLGLALPVLIILAIVIYFIASKRETETTVVDDPIIEEDEDDTPITQAISTDDVHTTVFRNEGSLGRFETLDGDLLYEVREQNVTIGRHSENDFQLNDETVHRHHAVFHISPEKRPVITDLDTTNGVVVNGARVSKTELNSGDIIEFGEAKIRFIAG